MTSNPRAMTAPTDENAQETLGLCRPQPIQTLGLRHPRVAGKYGWLESFLDRMGAPEHHRSNELFSLLSDPWKVEAALFARLVGIPWGAISSYLKWTGAYAPADYVGARFEGASFQFDGKLRPTEDGQLLYTSDGGKIRLFQCDFQVIPSDFARVMGGMDHSAMYFGAFIPELPEQLKNGFAYGLDHYHLPGAFSYIRFYREGCDFIITEIQSDHWKRFRDKHLRREVYADWHKVMLLAFEQYAATVTDGEHARVIVPDADYILARWKQPEEDDPLETPRRCDFQGISVATAFAYYENLPLDLGYEGKHESIQTREGNLKDGTLHIQHPWIKMLPSTHQGGASLNPLKDLLLVSRDCPFLSTYKELYPEATRNRNQRANSVETCSYYSKPLEDYRKSDLVFGSHRRIYEALGEDTPEAQEQQHEFHNVRYLYDGCFVLSVPSTPLDLERAFPKFPELVEVYEELQKQFLPEIPEDLMGKGIVVIEDRYTMHAYGALEGIMYAKSQEPFWRYRTPTATNGAVAYI